MKTNIRYVNVNIHHVKGLAVLNHQQNLSMYVESLVSQYGKHSDDHIELSIDMLPEDEQNELVKLYIESIDREIESACYGLDQSINSDFLCSLLSILDKDTIVTRNNFAEITRKNLINYYSKTLDDLLESSCENYFHSMMNEQGFYAQHDLEHGDVVWR